MNPDPINMKKNMTVDAVVKILRDVPEEAVLKTRYYKIKNVFGVKFDVPIPCILGKFGSWWVRVSLHSKRKVTTKAAVTEFM